MMNKNLMRQIKDMQTKLAKTQEELANTNLVKSLKRVLIQYALLDILRNKLCNIIPGKSKSHLRQVVCSKAEERAHVRSGTKGQRPRSRGFLRKKPPD